MRGRSSHCIDILTLTSSSDGRSVALECEVVLGSAGETRTLTSGAGPGRGQVCTQLTGWGGWHSEWPLGPLWTRGQTQWGGPACP